MFRLIYPHYDIFYIYYACVKDSSTKFYSVQFIHFTMQRPRMTTYILILKKDLQNWVFWRCYLSMTPRCLSSSFYCDIRIYTVFLCFGIRKKQFPLTGNFCKAIGFEGFYCLSIFYEIGRLFLMYFFFKLQHFLFCVQISNSEGFYSSHSLKQKTNTCSYDAGIGGQTVRNYRFRWNFVS